MSDVELISILLEQLSCELSLLDSILSEHDVGPAGETIFLVPCGLSVSQKDNLVNLFS